MTSLKKEDIIFCVDKCRWTTTDKEKIVRCKYTIPSQQMRKIIAWCESNIVLLTQDEINAKADAIIQTYDNELTLDEKKKFLKMTLDKLNEPYDVEKVVKDIYTEFGEVVTTIELKKIYELVRKNLNKE